MLFLDRYKISLLKISLPVPLVGVTWPIYFEHDYRITEMGPFFYHNFQNSIALRDLKIFTDFKYFCVFLLITKGDFYTPLEVDLNIVYFLSLILKIVNFYYIFQNSSTMWDLKILTDFFFSFFFLFCVILLITKGNFSALLEVDLKKNRFFLFSLLYMQALQNNIHFTLLI